MSTEALQLVALALSSTVCTKSSLKYTFTCWPATRADVIRVYEGDIVDVYRPQVSVAVSEDRAQGGADLVAD